MRRRATAALALAALLALGAVLVWASDLGSAKRQRSRGAPLVVVLILDELPADSLLRPDGQIDGARFPNFARLAATSTWFPNATTVYDSTFKAVPSILDAKLPERGTAPDARDHRRSVYTLFHRLGYGVVDTESSTALCPPRICRGARTRRPGVLVRLNRGGRPGRLRRWINSIQARRRPTLYLQHALLPHEPWLYLPSGRQARPAGNDPVEFINRPIGFHDPDLTRHNHQRYLLQLGFVDHELGVLLDRLERLGLMDRTLLAVTADHGYSFDVGTPDRRRVSDTNVDEVAPVPLFIKARRQRRARVNRGYVRTIDVVPTIAAQLRMRLDWRHDGGSAFGRAAQRRQSVRIVTRDFSRSISIGAAELERRRRANRDERAATFGTGFDSGVALGDPWASVYLIGPHPELLGQRPVALRLQAAGRARLANHGLLGKVGRTGRIVPARLTGRLSGGTPRTRRDLAAALNGRIVALGRSFYLRGDSHEYFSLMMPEAALRPGRNSVGLFEVASGGRLLELPTG